MGIPLQFHSRTQFFFSRRFSAYGGDLGQKGRRTKSPRIFEFSPRISLRILLRIFPEIFQDFSCFVSWETETTKNSPKIPPFFNAKSPGKVKEKIHKSFLESRQTKGDQHIVAPGRNPTTELIRLGGEAAHFGGAASAELKVVIGELQKGPAERGHVKKRQKSQKVSKIFSTLFDIFRAGQKTSKIVKKCQKVFRHFSTIFARHLFSGPFKRFAIR